MNKYSFKIIFADLQKRTQFEAKTNDEKFIKEFMISCFELIESGSSSPENRQIEAIQRNNAQFKKRFETFFNKYESTFPQLRELKRFVNNLEENQVFWILPESIVNDDLGIDMFSYLKADQEGRKREDILAEYKPIRNFMKTYSVKTLGTYRHGIGNKHKDQRQCRFCSKQISEVTFKKKAHAISEGLGNKTLVLYDECDTCNNQFSETIEPDIVSFFSVLRIIFDVKGKGGAKKIKGINFEMSKSGNSLNILFYDIKDRPKENPNEYKMTLRLKDQIKYQNVYRMLTKYFLSLIDQNELQHFSKTIDWVNGKISTKNLPLISNRLNYNGFSRQPIFTCYLRKNEDKTLPYAIGSLQFTCYEYVFVIPFADLDTQQFITHSEKETWWNKFTHFHTSNWSDIDFSSDEKSPFVFILDGKVS
ncbi:HNH endonuclease [Kordia sp.]|uniref:HNH endonuclease n=1 Tax=Kordia sp. TaxID=1965332 RepID=UPI003D6B5819